MESMMYTSQSEAVETLPPHHLPHRPVTGFKRKRPHSPAQAEGLVYVPPCRRRVIKRCVPGDEPSLDSEPYSSFDIPLAELPSSGFAPDVVRGKFSHRDTPSFQKDRRQRFFESSPPFSLDSYDGISTRADEQVRFVRKDVVQKDGKGQLQEYLPVVSLAELGTMPSFRVVDRVVKPRLLVENPLVENPSFEFEPLKDVPGKKPPVKSSIPRLSPQELDSLVLTEVGTPGSPGAADQDDGSRRPNGTGNGSSPSGRKSAPSKQQRVYRKPRVVTFAIFPFSGSAHGGEEVEIHFTLFSYARHRRSKKIVRVPFYLPDEVENPESQLRVFFGSRQARVISLQRSCYFDSKHLQAYMHASWDNCASGDYVMLVETPSNLGKQEAVDVSVCFAYIPFEGKVVNGYRYLIPPRPLPQQAAVMEFQTHFHNPLLELQFEKDNSNL